MFDYELKRSNRKSVAIRITEDCKIIVRAPLLLPKSKIDEFVFKHILWIEKHLKIRQDRQANKPAELTDDEIKALKQKARDYIEPKVSEYADIMGLEYGKVKITSAKTRYGSCNTGSHNLCFSFRLMLKPLNLVDYVIVHELAHIVHPDHSKAFYDYIEKYMPDYKQRIKQLKATERENFQ